MFPDPDGSEEPLILLHPPPPPATFPRQEEERATETTGEFEVFVDGKLVHSKKVILGERAEQGQRMGLGVLGGWNPVWTFSPLHPERRWVCG